MSAGTLSLNQGFGLTGLGDTQISVREQVAGLFAPAERLVGVEKGTVLSVAETARPVAAAVATRTPLGALGRYMAISTGISILSAGYGVSRSFNVPKIPKIIPMLWQEARSLTRQLHPDRGRDRRRIIQAVVPTLDNDGNGSAG